MVIDTSVIVAILLKEPERREFLRKLARAGSRQFSAVGYVESGMVLTSRFGDGGEALLDRMLKKATFSSSR
jgi:uncharacterized protein with PIN domain